MMELTRRHPKWLSLDRMLVIISIIALTCLISTETVAATIFMSEGGICAMPGKAFTLQCQMDGADIVSETIDFYRLGSDGTKYDINMADVSTKYHITQQSSCCHFVVAKLVVSNASQTDAGVYTCGVRLNDGSQGDLAHETVPVWVQHNAEFELSTNKGILSLGETFTVDPIISCNDGGTIRVTKTASDGAVMNVGYGEDLPTYVSKRNGLLTFNRFSCEDEGIYEFTYTYTQTDDYEPIETKRTLSIEACQGCCPKNPTAQTSTAGRSTYKSDTKQERVNMEPTSGQTSEPASTTAFIIVIVVLIIAVVLCVAIIMHFQCQIRRLKKDLSQAQCSNEEVEIPLNDDAPV